MVALKLGEEGFTKSHAESIYYLIYGLRKIIESENHNRQKEPGIF